MIFPDIIEDFVEVFDFSEREQEVIKEDLKRVIIADFITRMMDEDPQDENVALIRKMADSDNLEQVERVIATIFRSGTRKDLLLDVVKTNLNDWLEHISPVLDSTKQAKVPEARVIVDQIA